jgi:hypothetical protein
MRELLNEDMFLLSEIADKMEVSIPDTKGKDEKQIGMELIFKMFTKMYKAKKEINSLLGNVFNKSEDEMKKMHLKETKDLLKVLLKKEEVLNFFK